jgi:hypothetical protein
MLGIIQLTGCASLNNQECLETEWHEVGYADGVSGKDVDQLVKSQAACIAFPGSTGWDAYRQGYTEGLSVYCRPDRVFDLGRDGAAYPTQCPDDLAELLKASYGYGRNIYMLDADIRQLQERLNLKQKELQQAEAELAAIRTDREGRRAAAAGHTELKRQDNVQAQRVDNIKVEIEQLNNQLTSRQTKLNRLVSVLQ